MSLNKFQQNLTTLLAVPNIGRAAALKCLQVLKDSSLSWAEFWVNKYGIWQKKCLSEKQAESIKIFKKEHTVYSYIESLERRQISVISYQDAAYPNLLKQIDDFPLVLFVKAKKLTYCVQSRTKGRINRSKFSVRASVNCRQRSQKRCDQAQTDLAAIWNQRQCLGIVGTRRITPYGRLACQQLIKQLAVYQLCIVSGFMYGVDLFAHQLSLKHNLPTVGILGFGFDYMYPRSQQSIFEQCYDQGMVFFSEYPPEYQPQVGNFPRRNRLIAGLSAGVLVVEAAARSGSLITAGYAADYGREVLAVPGPLTSIYSEGTKKLLNDGATLMTSVQDLVQAIPAIGGLSADGKVGSAASQNHLVKSSNNYGPAGPVKQPAAPTFADQVLALLQWQTLSTDQLAEQLKLEVTTLNQALVQLELQGLITRQTGLWAQAQ